MKFCPNCGVSPVAHEVPEGDNRLRHICRACGEIHYSNPKIVCGTLPVWQGKVLLCKRAIEPRYGKWTLPAGFMENGESVLDGALRETHEEALTRVNAPQLLTVLSVPMINQVHMMFWGEMPSHDFGVTPESLAVQLFTEDEIPWDEIAFRTVKTTLEHYFACRRAGDYTLHVSTISH
jgi:ADP-ribose pyrophosphatase YjhB (NUDIX family)